MKRLIPILITAGSGLVLIVTYFIPVEDTVGFDPGETATIWFDILAAIAFILGGGNLLKVHLKKISDRAAGWGYSVIAIASFLLMLGAGLFKIGAPAADDQEYYGETFAHLPLSAFPETFEVSAQMPEDLIATGAEFEPSVRRQTTYQNETLTFRGWMKSSQATDLDGFAEHLHWRAAVEELADKAKPPEELRGSVAYHVDHSALGFQGVMSEEQKQALLELGNNENWVKAVETLFERSRKEQVFELNDVPADFKIPEELETRLTVISTDEPFQLKVQGPLSNSEADALRSQFPVARPLDDAEVAAFITTLNEKSDTALTSEQKELIPGFLQPSWNAETLIATANAAGEAKPTPKTAKELYEEQQAGVTELDPNHPPGDDVVLNEAQEQVIRDYVDNDEQRISELIANLNEAGELTGGQSAALTGFLGGRQTVGQRNKALCYALLNTSTLGQEQIDFLIAPYRAEIAWSKEVSRMLKATHTVKYPWSGDHSATGSVFWWLYEYAFTPLSATVFALLAFYVASAAFRAFRAKNIEASLLLGTAFIILLGRTYAGVALTSWLPDEVSGLKIENLTVWIMKNINSAGTRAIMIGIALGIASTSLKVLLGVDRSYLGSGDD